MAELLLYHLPGACSRVTITALEQIGVSYEDRLVNLMIGEQHSPAFMAANPRGKVPALLVDGELISENGAILGWLHRRWPEAGLLPSTEDSLAAARQMADLFWLSSFWHPTVRASRMPIRWTIGDPAPVQERGRQLLAQPMAEMNRRLCDHPWWYGEQWSICDTYFCWNYTIAESGGFSLAGLEGIEAHRQRATAHPAFQRALDRERAATERDNHGT